MQKTKPIPPRSLTRDEQISCYYSPRQALFIRGILSPEELDIIDMTLIGSEERMGVEDYLPIALTNWIISTKNQRLMKRFDRPNYQDTEHHRKTAAAWFKREEAIVYQREARAGRKATWNEVYADFQRNGNGLRHRIWYCLRFPEKVKLPRRNLT